MKVALVCPYDWSKPGGVKAHVANLALQLRGDHDVRIFAPASRPPGRTSADALVEPVGGAVPIPFNQSVAPVAIAPPVARRARRALAAFDPHVVHVHEPAAPLLSMVASAYDDAPVIGTFHAWSRTDRAYRLAAPVARRVVRRLDERLAVSTAAQQYAAAALRLPVGTFRVVPNGVDVGAFSGAEPLEHLVDPERPLVLFVGRLEERKGLEVLVRAYLRLRASTPGVRLCVVGEGPERERCQRMIPPAVRPDVLFVGAVGQEELPRYHASADVFASPALGGESFGIVLLEAMAAGLPVVASDIPGYRTVMKEGRQGRLVPPGNAFALAEALDTLLGNAKLRSAMGAEGRQTVERYAWPLVAAEVAARYRAVLRRRGG